MVCIVRKLHRVRRACNLYRALGPQSWVLGVRF